MARVIGLIVLSLAVAGLSGCAKSYSYRYRVTITVNVHGVPHTASNVVEVHESRGQTIDGASATAGFNGEALAVPLGNGRYLFALLGGISAGTPVPQGRDVSKQSWYVSPTDLMLRRYGLPTNWSSENDSGLVALASKKGVIKLGFDDLPDLVTFKNLNDQTSIVQLDPRALSIEFGPGTELTSATIEATSDPVSHGVIAKVLPWLNTRSFAQHYYLNGTASSSDAGPVLLYKNYMFVSNDP